MKRPSWDETWMKMASQLAEHSHDPIFKVGALIVTRENTRVLSLGFNGNGPGMPHFRESDEPGKSGFIHSESNAIIKLDYNDPAEKVMYVTLSPCRDCAKLIISARIREVVYGEEYRDTSGIELLLKYGVTVRQFLVTKKSSTLPKQAPDVMRCNNCGCKCEKGDRLVDKKGIAYCSYGCAEEDGAAWAQK